MLEITATGLTKRFARRRVVYDFTHHFPPGSVTAVVGHNGSGKSTLLRLLSGQLLPSEGDVRFRVRGADVPAERRYRQVSLTGPYLELVEELSGEELLDFHGKVRGFRQNLRPADLWARLDWGRAVRRERIGAYSSGMKQRVRLLLALATDAPCVMLDEPTANLDVEGVAWYLRLLDEWIDDRTLLVASNEERDFPAGAQRIDPTFWRKPKTRDAVPTGTTPRDSPGSP